MIDPGTVGTIGGIIAAITSVLLVYIKNNGAFNIEKLKNRTVSEQLFKDELSKRDDAISKLQNDMNELIRKYAEQHQQDMIAVQTWKDKYDEQVQINTRLQSDFQTLKDKIVESTNLIHDKVEEIKQI